MIAGVALTLLLTAFDGYISYRRIKAYGKLAEVNMLVRQVITDFGLAAGLTVGALYNLCILGALLYFKLPSAIWFWCGTKFGLCLMQLKSMQMESFVERVLAAAKQRQANKVTGPMVSPSTQ